MKKFIFLKSVFRFSKMDKKNVQNQKPNFPFGKNLSKNTSDDDGHIQFLCF